MAPHADIDKDFVDRSGYVPSEDKVLALKAALANIGVSELAKGMTPSLAIGRPEKSMIQQENDPRIIQLSFDEIQEIEEAVNCFERKHKT